jgi:large subunit ribosomal protein L25
MSEVTIEVQRRSASGSATARRLRNEGWIPAVVYGGGKETLAVQVDRKTLLELFKAGGHENRIFLLQLAGTDKSRHAMIRDMQMDPMTHQVRHIDFQRVMMDVKIKVKVHLELVGLPYGVKNEAGILDFVSREIEVECLPADIPHDVKIDVSALHIGQHIEASAIELPATVKLLTEPEKVIAAVSHARVEAEPEVAAPAEGAAAPAAEGAAAKEPEVIKRGKVAEEGEES